MESLLKKEEELLVALNFQVNISHPQSSITSFLSHYRNHLPPVSSNNLVRLFTNLSLFLIQCQSYKPILTAWEIRAISSAESLMVWTPRLTPSLI
jgi:hypothetical protein